MRGHGRLERLHLQNWQATGPEGGLARLLLALSALATVDVADAKGECFPSKSNTGEYACTEMKYCSNQGSASKHGTITLSKCMALCKNTGCKAIQYDCNTDCWLLDSCGSYKASTCGSSVYVRDLSWGAVSTTTIVSPTVDSKGKCFPDTSNGKEYACTERKYCSNQESASKHGKMSLSNCMALCRSRGCEVIQYDCNSDCYLLESCGTYLASTCGSSVYVRDFSWGVVITTTTPITTIKPTQVVSIAATSTQFIINDLLANTTTLPMQIVSTTTMSARLVNTAVASTTTSAQVVTQVREECFPNTSNSGEYACTKLKICSNQGSASKHGKMSLSICMDLCKSRGCKVIQYVCNTECYLLDSCDSYIESRCGSSVYVRDSSWHFPSIGVGHTTSKPSETCGPNEFWHYLEKRCRVCRANFCRNDASLSLASHLSAYVGMLLMLLGAMIEIDMCC